MSAARTAASPERRANPSPDDAGEGVTGAGQPEPKGKRREFAFHFPLPLSKNQTDGNPKIPPKFLRVLKKRYYAELDELMVAGKLPASPRNPIPFAAATVTVHLRNRMDDGNMTHRLKWPEDWMKSRGFIVDDRRPYFRLLNIPEQIIDRSGRDPVIIMHIVEVLDDGDARP